MLEGLTEMQRLDDLSLSFILTSFWMRLYSCRNSQANSHRRGKRKNRERCKRETGTSDVPTVFSVGDLGSEEELQVDLIRCLTSQLRGTSGCSILMAPKGARQFVPQVSSVSAKSWPAVDVDRTSRINCRTSCKLQWALSTPASLLNEPPFRFS